MWVADSTPVECGRSRETAKRSELAGWAEYGYCASHTCYFWACDCTWCAPCTAYLWVGRWSGPRPTNAMSWKTLLATTPALARPEGRRRTVIADKAYYGKQFEARLDQAGIDLLRPARKREGPKPTHGSSGHCDRSSSPSTTPSLKANSTSNYPEAAPLPACVRIAQRVLALVAAIWHNDHTGALSSAHWSPTTIDP